MVANPIGSNELAPSRRRSREGREKEQGNEESKQGSVKK
jgi:hypothetical protein